MKRLIVRLKVELFDRLYRAKEQVLMAAVDRLPNWLKPNHITAVRLFILAPLLNLYLWLGNWTAVWALLAAGFATDALDGPLARRRRQVTTSGSFIDALADKVMTVPMLCIIGYRHIDPGYFWLIIVREILIMLFSAVSLKRRDKIQSNRWGMWYMAMLGLLLILLVFGAQPSAINATAAATAAVGLISLPYYWGRVQPKKQSRPAN